MSALDTRDRSDQVGHSYGCGRTNGCKPQKPADRQKLKPTRSTDRTNRRGAAVVEFAVLAPLLFLLVFGMPEYGRMVMVQQILTNAAREGCRQAVLEGVTTSAITNTVQSYLSSSTIEGAKVTVSPDPPSGAGPGGPVTVAVSVSFDQVSWLPAPMYLSGKEMWASSTMRRETAQ